MPSAIITKEFRFEAAHQLPHHKGKCSQLHGHSYVVEVGLYGPISPAEGHSYDGMVEDFATVSGFWKDVLEPLLDHQFLNESLHGELPDAAPNAFQGWALTTAENLAWWLFARFEAEFKGMTRVVRVYETATSSAIVSRWEWLEDE